MFDDEIIAVANDSAQADRLATESAVKECYEQHKAAWESWDKGEPVVSLQDVSRYVRTRPILIMVVVRNF